MQLVKPSYQIESVFSGDAMLRAIEEYGRVCYKSEESITPDSAEKFVRMIVSRGHHSVLEHASISVRFIVDRGVTHELVRHRLASFSQESTRYCNYSKGGQIAFVIPPWVKIEPGHYCGKGCCADWPKFDNAQDVTWFFMCRGAEVSYLALCDNGWSPQQARGVLPNSLKTEIVVTANLREWRHIFDVRCSTAAHPQMQEVMVPLREELRRRIPVVFDEA